MTPPVPLRAAIYLRMSLDRELGIDRQREDCLALCERLGWAPVEYVDLDRSATKANVVREDYQRMCKDIEAGDIDAIITWRSDRLYRTMKDLLSLIILVHESGRRIPIETCQTGLLDLTTDSGRMTAKIHAAVSENEGEVRLARQRRALEQLASSGRGWGATAFGYIDDHYSPAVVKREAAAIRRAYKDFLAGATLYSIAKQWNEVGFRTGRGNPWNGTTIGRLLKNPRYAGLRSFRGEIVGKGDWPAIVSEETWEEACFVLNDPTRRSSHLYVRKQLLGGILRCGSCGRGLGSGSNGKGSTIYRCNNYGVCQGGPARRAEVLDAWVRDVIIKRLGTQDWVSDKRAEQEAARVLHEEAVGIRTRMDSLANDFAEGDLTASQLRIATEKLQGKLAGVESALTHTSGSHVFEGLLGVKDVESYWDALSIDKRRAIIRMLCEKIVVHPLGGITGKAANRIPVGDGIEVHWHQA